MQKVIKCKSNQGFENLLTVGKQYNRIALGVNSMLIEADNGERKWLGFIHFHQN